MPQLFKWLKQKIKKTSHSKKQTCVKDIAIIGMACRFPGAKDYHQFWDNLKAGKNSIQEITPDRWDVSKYYSPDRSMPNKSISKWGGLLDQVDSFDASFFNISPREAVAMDPQQRLLLEETWRCIEDSGVTLKELQRGNTSVYVGVMSTDYQNHLLGLEHTTDSYECLGNYEGILANRLSYFFNFTGESQSIDAACASSLVALHDAKRSLLHGESDYAFAGGVSVICHPWKYISFSKSNMLSPDGQCKTFDAEANGYVPAEGVGVLLLCSLKKAIKNGYHVYGIIKGSAVKHAGKSLSITAPRIEIERQVIEDAIQDSHVDSESITYLEAHGTGTSLGDPLEIEALTRAFHTDKKQYCQIGSVKTNIGHAEAAAGIAGVIKVLLMFQHQKIPKTLNIKTVNPIINFDQSPFCLADKLSEWKLADSIPYRRAGVSSFGFGGINAHAILEEYIPPIKSIKEMKTSLPFILSAKTTASLEQLLMAWQSHVKTERFQSQALENICYTLMGRETFAFRYGGQIHNKNELVNLLETAITQNELRLGANAKLRKKLLILRLQPVQKLKYSVFHKLCEQYPLLNTLETEYLDAIRSLKQGKALLEKVFNDNDSTQPLSQLIALSTLGHALLMSGLHPRYIISEEMCKLEEAVLCGMIDFKTAVQWLTKEKTVISFKRPNISFYDTQQKKIIEPYYISEAYCQTLISQLSIDPSAQEKLFKKSSLLLSNQFTFKKYLEEWKKY